MLKRFATIALAAALAVGAPSMAANAANVNMNYKADTVTLVAINNEIKELNLLIEGAEATQSNLISLIDQLRNYKTLDKKVADAKRIELVKELGTVNTKLNELYGKLYSARQNYWEVLKTGKAFISDVATVEADAAVNCTRIQQAVREVVNSKIAQGEIVSVTCSSNNSCNYAETNADKNVLAALQSKLADVKGDYVFSVSIYPGDTAEDVVNTFLSISLSDGESSYVYTQGKLYQMN